MKTSLVLPSKGRPWLWFRMLNSALTNAAYPGEIKIYTGFTQGDPTIPEYHKITEELYKRGYGVPDFVTFDEFKPEHKGRFIWNELALQAVAEGADFVWAGSDDVLFTSAVWDKTLARIAQQADKVWPDKNYFIWGEDGSCGARHATHPFVRSNWITTLGKLFPECCQHFDGDTFLTELGRELKRGIFTPDIYTKHDNPKYTGGQHDATWHATKPLQKVDYDSYRGPTGKAEVTDSFNKLRAAMASPHMAPRS